MKSISVLLGMGVVGLIAMCGSALAAPGPFNPLPEPGSLALVGIAVAAMVAVSRKGKK